MKVQPISYNASRASFLTLQRYAQACGSELKVAML